MIILLERQYIGLIGPAYEEGGLDEAFTSRVAPR